MFFFMCSDGADSFGTTKELNRKGHTANHHHPRSSGLSGY